MEPDKRSQLTALLAGASDEARGAVAARFAKEFADGRYTGDELARAVSVLERLARDVAESVRRIVSEQLRHCGLLPHALAVRMAEDIASVAVPLLRHSPVLTDDDLLAVIAGGDSEKQCAIAARDHVSETISGALIETRKQAVVETLLVNDGSEISDEQLDRVIDGFADDPAVHQRLIDRRILPLRTIERLIGVVSAQLCERIVTEHNFPRHIADQIVAQGREAAIMEQLGGENSVGEIEALVVRLHAEGKLTPTLVLRALCQGDLHFYESAMAALAEMPRDRTREMLHDRGAGGLRMVFRKTGLPDEIFRALKVATKVAHEFRKRPDQTQLPSGFTESVIARLVEEYDQISPGNIDHVLNQIAAQVAAG